MDTLITHKCEPLPTLLSHCLSRWEWTPASLNNAMAGHEILTYLLQERVALRRLNQSTMHIKVCFSMLSFLCPSPKLLYHQLFSIPISSKLCKSCKVLVLYQNSYLRMLYSTGTDKNFCMTTCCFSYCWFFLEGLAEFSEHNFILMILMEPMAQPLWREPIPETDQLPISGAVSQVPVKGPGSLLNFRSTSVTSQLFWLNPSLDVKSFVPVCFNIDLNSTNCSWDTICFRKDSAVGLLSSADVKKEMLTSQVKKENCFR